MPEPRRYDEPMLPDQMRGDMPGEVLIRIPIDFDTKADDLPKGRMPTAEEFKKGFPAPAILEKLYRTIKDFGNSKPGEQQDSLKKEIYELIDRIPDPPPQSSVPSAPLGPLRGPSVAPQAAVPDTPDDDYEPSLEEVDELVRELDRTPPRPVPQ